MKRTKKELKSPQKTNPKNASTEKNSEEQKSEKAEKARFEMTKKHHAETFEKALKEGRVDEAFVPFCKYIETTKHYFTTSCCSGRIALVSLNKEETKQESAFHRKWHRKVKEKEIIEAIKDFEGEVLWFKQEPIILHLGADTLENARKIIALCDKTGIKRAGIKVVKDGKWIAEILGTQQMNVPIKEKKQILVPEEYIKYLVKKANEKFEKNLEMLQRFEKEAKETLK